VNTNRRSPSRVRKPALAAAVSFVAAAAVAVASPSTPAVAAKARWTVQDIMDRLIDPSADALWEAVGTVETAKGVEHRAPKSPAGWAKAEAEARALVEGAVRLKSARAVGANGGKGLADATTPGIRSAKEIEREIRADPARFAAAAEQLRRAGVLSVEATQARDADRLLGAGAAIDAACESCHAHYWYPRQRLTLPSRNAFAAHVWQGS